MLYALLALCLSAQDPIDAIPDLRAARDAYEAAGVTYSHALATWAEKQRAVPTPALGPDPRASDKARAEAAVEVNLSVALLAGATKKADDMAKAEKTEHFNDGSGRRGAERVANNLEGLISNYLKRRAQYDAAK